MASLTDKVTDTRNGARPNSARVTGTRAAGVTSLSCDNLTGWPTSSKVHFVTYQVDTNSDVVAGTQCDWEGIVSGSSIGSLTLHDGTDTGNSVGDVVEMLPTAAWGQDLADGIEVAHDRTGAHKSGATYPVPVIADFTSANHDHGDADDGGALVLAAIPDTTITSVKLVEAFFRGRKQTDDNNTIANTAPTGLTIQYGWVQITGAAATKISETVTFPTAFSSAPIVIVGSLAAKTGGTAAADITALLTAPSADGWVAMAEDITTTNFAANAIRPTGVNFTLNDRYGVSWLAIGVV